MDPSKNSCVNVLFPWGLMLDPIRRKHITEVRCVLLQGRVAGQRVARAVQEVPRLRWAGPKCPLKRPPSAARLERAEATQEPSLIQKVKKLPVGYWQGGLEAQRYDSIAEFLLSPSAALSDPPCKPLRPLPKSIQDGWGVGPGLVPAGHLVRSIGAAEVVGVVTSPALLEPLEGAASSTCLAAIRNEAAGDGGQHHLLPVSYDSSGDANHSVSDGDRGSDGRINTSNERTAPSGLRCATHACPLSRTAPLREMCAHGVREVLASAGPPPRASTRVHGVLHGALACRSSCCLAFLPSVPTPPRAQPPGSLPGSWLPMGPWRSSQHVS